MFVVRWALFKNHLWCASDRKGSARFSRKACMLQVGPMEQKNDQNELPNEQSDNKPIAETKSDEVATLLELACTRLVACMYMYIFRL